MPLTTVQITTETRKKLAEYKDYRRETYDEIIRKLMDIVSKVKTEGELSQDALDDIAEGKKQYAQGKGMSTRKLLEELGA